MFKLILICLLAIPLTSEPCAKGCLRCEDKSDQSGTKICTFCDTSLNYKMNLTTNVCELFTTVESCSFYSMEGVCLQCSNDKIVQDGKCTDVTTKVASCLKYQSLDKCQTCISGRYLTTTGTVQECKSVTTLIDNCDIYKEDQTCESCASNYRLLDNKCALIDKDNKTANCLAFYDFTCKQCQSDYLSNQNLVYVGLINNIDNIMENQRLDMNTTTRKIYQQFEICQKTEGANCIQFESQDKCSQCSSNYYLTTDKQCKEYPKPEISNCINYSSLQKCVECDQGYHLDSNDTLCKKVVVTDLKCAQYDGRSGQITCTKCTNDHYLVGGTCEVRNKDIENCKTYKNDKQQCAECNSSFVTVDDGDSCVEKIDNCITQNSDISFTVSCQTCEDNYYRKQTPVDSDNKKKLICENKSSLTSDSIQKCIQFRGVGQNYEECSLCEVPYVDTQCQKQYSPIIDNCTIYNTSEYFCDTCNDKFQQFTVKNYCADKDNLKKVIDNCVEYTADGYCKKCSGGYKTKTGADNMVDCSTVITGCETTNSEEKCTACSDNFGLNELNQTCNSTLFSYVESGCEMKNFTDSKSGHMYQTKCDVCKENNFHYTHPDHSPVCVNNNGISQTAVVTLSNKSSDKLLQFFKEETMDTIVGCFAYENHTTCLRCVENKRLQNNECVDTCTSKSFDAALYSGTSDIKINKCRDTGTDGTFFNAPSMADKTANIALSCQNDYFPVGFTIAEGVIEHSNFKPVDESNKDNWVSHPKDFYPVKICKKDLVKVNGSATVLTKDVNCKFYLEGDTNEVTCQTCVDGKKATQVNVDGFLDSCSDNCGKDNNKFLNTPVYWNQFFSCAQCNTSRITSVVSGDFGADWIGFVKMQRYYKKSDAWLVQTDTDVVVKDNQSCVTLETRSQIQQEFTKDPLVDMSTKIPEDGLKNCAMAALNTGMDKSTFQISYKHTFTDAEKTSGKHTDFTKALLLKDAIRCVACKNGFRPIVASDATVGEDLFIVGCVEIDNCDISDSATDQESMVNGCNKCDNNYVHAWENNKINYASCVKISTRIKSCRAMDIINETEEKQKCMACDNGLSLNKNNICVEMIIPNCSNYTFVEDFSTDSSYLYYRTFKGFGCNSCKDNNYSGALIPAAATKETCIEHKQTNSNDDIRFVNFETGDNIYIDNCENYENTSNLKCHKCMNDSADDVQYVLTQDKMNCHSGVNKQYCEQFENGSDTTRKNCLKCYDNKNVYLKQSDDGDRCLLVNQPTGEVFKNCDEFYLDEAKEETECKTCKEGFYKQGTKECIKGDIPFCKVYSSQDTCTACQNSSDSGGTNYVLYKDGLKNYCFADNFKMSCKDNNYTTSENFQIECNDCEPHQDIIAVTSSSTKFPSKVCALINQVSNCKTTSKTLELNGTKNGYFCDECNDGFYLNQDNKYVCNTRTTILSCLTYEISSDDCMTCKAGFFLSTDKKSCNAYPKGKIGCEIYQDENTCTKCENDYYLANGSCNKVTTLIPNCSSYVNDNSCEKCKSKYVLDNNECFDSKIDNCITASITSRNVNVYSCSLCDGNKHPSDDGKTCVNNTSNCLVYDQVAKTCTLCDQNRYLIPKSGDTEEKCEEKIIKGCKYPNKTTCDQCNADFYLNLEKGCDLKDETNSLLQKDEFSKCEVLEQTVDYQCYLCNPGYYFKDGKCTEFSENKFSTGCAYANPLKESECLFCRPKYYMNTNGACVNTDSGNGGEGGGSSVKRLSILLFIFTLLFQIN